MGKSKIKNWAVNIDKLKVCLNIEDDIYTYLKEHFTRIVNKENKTIRVLDEDYFSLHFFDEQDTKMSAILNVKDTDGWLKLGTFVFHCGNKYKNKAFFTYDNSALYTISTYNYDGTPNNHICDLSYVVDYYGMSFNNITTVEIAFDSDFNFIKKIRAMIKNTEHYDLYLNGKKVGNNEILEGYGEYYSRNRLKLQLPTLYFSQAKDSDMQMKVYDKARELNESTPYKKEKIKRWLGWNEGIYRVEILFHNTNIRDYFKRYEDRLPQEMGGHDNVLSLLCISDFRTAMFVDACDRLIFFKSKITGEKISLLEIAEI